jgi:hypothetical protein
MKCKFPGCCDRPAVLGKNGGDGTRAKDATATTVLSVATWHALGGRATPAPDVCKDCPPFHAAGEEQKDEGERNDLLLTTAGKLKATKNNVWVLTGEKMKMEKTVPLDRIGAEVSTCAKIMGMEAEEGVVDHD